MEATSSQKYSMPFDGSHWGITMAQLQMFVDEVHEFHYTGRIHNPSPSEQYHNPRFNGSSCGPNVHQVNWHVIDSSPKPTHQVNQDVIKVITSDPTQVMRVTQNPDAQAHVGWALMMNPQGLKVDLFVSHGIRHSIY